MSYPYRVFLSYAHSDLPIVEQIGRLLEDLGIELQWDRRIRPGEGFSNAIMDLISRSHIFMPVIAKNFSNNQNPWVHQEVGYAIALQIPVLPVSIDGLPSEMLSPYQALKVKADLSDFVDEFSKIDLDELVIPLSPKPFGIVEIADSPSERTKLVADGANWLVDKLGVYGLLRLQAKLHRSQYLTKTCYTFLGN
jgi:hypothetical protein